MTIDDIKRYTVQVSSHGSGVLFQANVAENTYILTAKHNFKELGNGKDVAITINTHLEGNWGKDVITFTRKDGENYFPHEDDKCDALILVIPYRAGYDKIIAQHDFSQKIDYNLCGYPLDKAKVESSHEFKFKAHTIDDFKDSKNFLQAGITRKNQNQENLSGISGGGVFGLTADYLFLLGIQSEIVKSANPEGEFDYVPIRFFDEIICQDTCRDHLDPLLPGFMKDLHSLMSEIMQLKECVNPGFIARVRAIMEEKLGDITHTPKEILGSSIKPKMLVANEKDSAYMSRVLWCSWLEYLLVLTVVGSDISDISALEKLFDSVRLVHSDTDETWQSIIADILSTDYSEQAEDSIVLVSTKVRPSAKFTIAGGIVDRIDDIPGVVMNIGRTTQLSRIRKFVHIKAFETECIVRNDEELGKFKASQAAELLASIKTRFNELLSN